MILKLRRVVIVFFTRRLYDINKYCFNEFLCVAWLCSNLRPYYASYVVIGSASFRFRRCILSLLCFCCFYFVQFSFFEEEKNDRSYIRLIAAFSRFLCIQKIVSIVNLLNIDR